MSQSVGTTITDNAEAFLAPERGTDESDESDEDGRASVVRLQGLQLITSVTGNTTLDIPTGSFDHSSLFGVSFTQMVPTAAAADAADAFRQRTTTVQATASYLGRRVTPTWGWSFGANYGFGLNGRLGSAADGSLEGGGAGSTLPGADLGAFVLSGQTHTVEVQTGLELTRVVWDASFGLTYGYTRNGVFTLTSGGIDQQVAGDATGSNIGGFIPVTAHTFGASAGYRRTVGRGTIEATLAASLALPQQNAPASTSSTTPAFASTLQAPRSITNGTSLRYTYAHTADRSFGADAAADLLLREPLQAAGSTADVSAGGGGGMSPETLILTAGATYEEFFHSWQLGLRLRAGVAQAHIFQSPLAGLTPGGSEPFEPIHGRIQPVLSLGVGRAFNPFDVAIELERSVGAGAIGVSAVIAERAALVVGYFLEIAGRRITLDAGFNVGRSRGIDDESLAVLFPTTDATPGGPAEAIAIANNNVSMGANALLSIPLYVDGSFAVDSSLAYNFNWVDPDPNDLREGRLSQPILTHVGLFMVRGTWGRGTLQGATNAGGLQDFDPEDPAMTRTSEGGRLGSSSLLTGGAPLLGTGGRRPGEPAKEDRADSASAYEANQRRARRTTSPEANRSQPVKPVGSDDSASGAEEER